MSLRDWFAGMALQETAGWDDDMAKAHIAAERAYGYADAMIAARKPTEDADDGNGTDIPRS
jgi:hypothetical protein